MGTEEVGTRPPFTALSVPKGTRESLEKSEHVCPYSAQTALAVQTWNLNSERLLVCHSAWSAWRGRKACCFLTLHWGYRVFLLDSG